MNERMGSQFSFPGVPPSALFLGFKEGVWGGGCGPCVGHPPAPTVVLATGYSCLAGPLSPDIFPWDLLPFSVFLGKALSGALSPKIFWGLILKFLSELPTHFVLTKSPVTHVEETFRPHLTDGETEAQSWGVSCLGRWPGWGLGFCILDLRAPTRNRPGEACHSLMPAFIHSATVP